MKSLTNLYKPYKMAYLSFILFIFAFQHINAQSLVTDVKINARELRCLVCKKSVDELTEEIKKIDPDKTVDVGGHRLDADGNYRHKAVPQAKSELHLSEIIEGVCNQMDNYVRAVWKANGTLTLFSMVKDGKMNADFDNVQIVQDDDLNKSLKYYCESIMEEFEENIIKLYQEDAADITTQFCIEQTKICLPNEGIKQELEIILTRQLHHPNIITYLTTFVSGPEVCVVSPLMAYGSCRDLLTRNFNEGLSEQAIIIITRDILDGLDYLHRKGYIHRAIRASHILVSATGRAYIAGLRYACPIVQHGRWQRSIHSFPASTERNLNWLSPELLEQNLQGYNEKSDIYSVGIVICELANGSEPFSGMLKTLMLTEKVRGWVPQLLDCTTVPRDENIERTGDCEVSNNVMNRRFSEYLHELAGLCLHREAYDRPTAGQLLTHPIFKTHKKTLPLPELLKPALPLSDRVAYDTDGMEDLETLNQMSQLELYSCEWDF
ncbi:hypothetical protein NQ318_018547 [Aromia moschata]|uniref:Protein kinase domain-containing protein n=1 Tax=Aromia moschata TaxID=1265417 RepID=A0AAV8ZFJ3_9CUCU|nr:hypothetical protein NQ318_018547 [Aromia moschata]